MAAAGIYVQAKALVATGLISLWLCYTQNNAARKGYPFNSEFLMQTTLRRLVLVLASLSTLAAGTAQAEFQYRTHARGLLPTVAPSAPRVVPQPDPVVPEPDPYISRVASLFSFDGSTTSHPTVSTTPTAVAYAKGVFGQALDLHANTPGNPRVTDVVFSISSIGTQDFTVEGWLNTTVLSAFGNETLIAGPSFANLLLRPSNRADALYVGAKNCGAFPANTWTDLNTWNHFAIVRASGVASVYKNGALVKTCTGASGSIPAGTWKIGARESGAESYSGMVDDIRITIGIARYNGPFTVPTQAYPTF